MSLRKEEMQTNSEMDANHYSFVVQTNSGMGVHITTRS